MAAKAVILGNQRVPLHAGIHPKQYKIAPVSGGTIIFLKRVFPEAPYRPLKTD